MLTMQPAACAAATRQHGAAGAAGAAAVFKGAAGAAVKPQHSGSGSSNRAEGKTLAFSFSRPRLSSRTSGCGYLSSLSSREGSPQFCLS